jgi:hypothetical protein
MTTDGVGLYLVSLPWHNVVRVKFQALIRKYAPVAIVIGIVVMLFWVKNKIWWLVPSCVHSYHAGTSWVVLSSLVQPYVWSWFQKEKKDGSMVYPASADSSDYFSYQKQNHGSRDSLGTAHFY